MTKCVVPTALWPHEQQIGARLKRGQCLQVFQFVSLSPVKTVKVEAVKCTGMNGRQPTELEHHVYDVSFFSIYHGIEELGDVINVVIA